ncbi:hypothetical protein ACIBCM_29990 [Streptomyces sp. NPDC051018]|uniref:hypothetical protein n=1 Tax=Streptomyces sp. NPDC051018 TaxID=3365639 RepID=UPI0037A27DCF
MSSTPDRGPVRSAAELNKLLRGLWVDGVLPADRRPEYEALVVQWAEAVQAEGEVTAEAA